MKIEHPEGNKIEITIQVIFAVLTSHVQHSGAYHWDMLEKILWGMQKQDKLVEIGIGRSGASLF